MKQETYIIIDHENGNELSVVTEESKIGQEFIDSAKDDEVTILHVQMLPAPTGVQVRKAVVDEEPEDEDDPDTSVANKIVDWELVR